MPWRDGEVRVALDGEGLRRYRDLVQEISPATTKSRAAAPAPYVSPPWSDRIGGAERVDPVLSCEV